MKCQLFSCFFFNRDSRTFRTNTPIKWLSLSMMFILIVWAPALQGAAAPSLPAVPICSEKEVAS